MASASQLTERVLCLAVLQYKAGEEQYKKITASLVRAPTLAERQVCRVPCPHVWSMVQPGQAELQAAQGRA
eukprot:386-Rhodomonas_salina.3